MANCKECLHYEACKSFADHDGFDLALWTEKHGLWCNGEHFKYRSQFVEMPCPIGTTVYIIGGKYRGGRFDRWINTGKFRVSDLEKIGKTVFLTQADAEKALERDAKMGVYEYD